MYTYLYRLASVAVLAVLFAACGTSTGLERSDRTTSSMESVDEDITRTIEELNAVERNLNDLIRPGQREVREVYDRYRESVGNLENYGGRFISNLQDMDNRADSYFSQWQSENQNYENERLRDVAEERRRRVQSQYEEILAEKDGLEDHLEAYISDNRELQRYLSNDLTAEGIESIAPMIEEVIEESYYLRERLSNVQNTVEGTKEGMARRGRQVN